MRTTNVVVYGQVVQVTTVPKSRFSSSVAIKDGGQTSPLEGPHQLRRDLYNLTIIRKVI